MDALIECTRVLTLLEQLTGVSFAEEELPLPLVLNLHKGALRRPLAALADLTEGPYGLDSTQAMVAQLYPAANQSLLGGIAMEDAYGEAHPNHGMADIDRGAPAMSLGVAKLMGMARADWTNFDPAITLHELSWTDAPIRQLAYLLELQLEAMPGMDEVLLAWAQREMVGVDG